MGIDLLKFLMDVFGFRPVDKVAILTDLPTSAHPVTPEWDERQAMVAIWYEVLQELADQIGFEHMGSFSYPATGSNGADLPDTFISCKDVRVSANDVYAKATVILSFSQYSATAPLNAVAKKLGRDEDGNWQLRVASMPGITLNMQVQGLAADYTVVAERAQLLRGYMEDADAADVAFSSGHACHFDLRFNHKNTNFPEADDGYLHADKEGDSALINLPAGETFQVPNEDGDSETAGDLPLMEDGELIVFRVEANRIVDVMGSGPRTEYYRQFFRDDPARANIAEFAFGCNPNAVVTGNVLQDEKAGFHWAYGRSDHLGGLCAPDSFKGAAVHQDTVYAAGNPIQVTEAVLLTGDGPITIIKNGQYVIFDK